MSRLELVYGASRHAPRHVSPLPTITGLLPTWNRREYLARAVDSMLEQSHPVDEILIIDDGSSDGSAAYLRARYGRAVRVVEQVNTGVGGALRRGVEEARGEWIAILNSDDRWTPERNRLFARAAREVPEDVAWIFADTRVVTDAGAGATLFLEHGFDVRGEVEVIDEPLRTQYPLQMSFLQSSLIRASVLRRLGCFAEKLRASEDVLAGFQVACHHRFAACPFVATELYRTAELRASSLDLAYRESPDYFEARIKAFSLAHQAGMSGPWAAKHAEAVRGLCKLRLASGASARRLACEQFRCGFHWKSLAFFLIAELGQPGYSLWRALARLRQPRSGRALWHELAESQGARR